MRFTFDIANCKPLIPIPSSATETIKKVNELKYTAENNLVIIISKVNIEREIIKLINDALKMFSSIREGLEYLFKLNYFQSFC